MRPQQRFETFKMKHNAMLFGSLFISAIVLPGLLSDLARGEAPGQAAANDGRPNMIIVMADDMGFSDLGCYGGEIKTPTIDRLAAEGLRFSQFYNCALCGPSRASLMTGCYPWDVGQAPGTSIFANLPNQSGQNRKAEPGGRIPGSGVETYADPCKELFSTLRQKQT